MVGLVDADWLLYDRMQANLLASWAEYATGSPGARLERLTGAAAAVFPAEPERAVYNNALLGRGAEARDAIGPVEEAYAREAITNYTIWAHESDAASIEELERRGYHVDTWTRAMAMELDAVPAYSARPEIVVSDWQSYLEILVELGAPAGLLTGIDGRAFEVLIGWLDGARVAAALAYDYDGDCGIYNVGTVPSARRRGLATSLTRAHLQMARERGCVSASLQATEMAQGLYAALGFRDLGRFIEYAR